MEKLLIYVVAYNHEKFIEKVLDRIDQNLFDKYETEILINDDSSSDDTFVGDDIIVKSEVGVATSVNAAMNNEGGGIIDQFIDSLTHPNADMVRVEMQILGDVAYMGQAQYMPPSFKGKSIIDEDGDISYFRVKPHSGGSQPVFNNKIGAYNPDIADPVINLQFRFPTDRDTNTGLFELSKEESATFSGLYRVFRVDNNFDQGQFLRTLHMVRFANQGDTVTEDVGLDSVKSTIKGERVERVNFDSLANIWMNEKSRFENKVVGKVGQWIRGRIKNRGIQ